MEYEKIKQLMDDMGNSKLTAVDIEFPDGTKVSMKKEVSYQTVNVAQEVVPQVFNNTMPIQSEPLVEEKNGNIVTSPMVGTFYMRPSPTSEPYVEVGKEVKAGDILCIIEAMKLMNEIESEYSGKVVEILVKDGDTVEFGTPLFRINE